MNMTHLRDLDSIGARAASPDQADRLLRSMQKVCRHDLPNQLVVLQSLLKLLSLEESDCLSAEGREYLRRLQNATRQAGGLARFLKEMAGLNNRSPRLETIALAGLARELQGGLQHLYPARHFAFAWDWRVPAIIGDARLLVQAILELYAGLAHSERGECRLAATAQEHADIIELAFTIEELPADEPGLAQGKPRALDERLEIILAREWLALCGTGVEVMSAGAAEARFSLILPNR